MNKIFAFFYELLGKVFGVEISHTEALYENGTYIILGGSLFVVTLLIAFFFYKVIDPIKWANLIGWIYTAFINALIQFIIAYVSCVNVVDSHSFSIAMGFINFFYALLLFFLVSIPIKYLSVNNYHNPF